MSRSVLLLQTPTHTLSNWNSNQLNIQFIIGSLQQRHSFTPQMSTRCTPKLWLDQLVFITPRHHQRRRRRRCSRALPQVMLQECPQAAWTTVQFRHRCGLLVQGGCHDNIARLSEKLASQRCDGRRQGIELHGPSSHTQTAVFICIAQWKNPRPGVHVLKRSN